VNTQNQSAAAVATATPAWRLRAFGVLTLGTALALGNVLPAQETQTAAEEPLGEASDTLPSETQTSRPVTFADLAELVSPSVVNITTSTVVSRPTGPDGVVPEGSPFEDFFNGPGDGGPRRSSALGSGFVISPDGYIVTNNHVIDGADEIEIEFYPGGADPVPAEIVGTDPNTDLALLKVDLTDLPFVAFGDSDGSGAQVGSWVMAMGNPLGQGFSVSAGIVSARNRELAGTYDDYIQTDAAINRGNSGGPLFNMDGEVIGVNTAILSPNGGSIGIGFAMSSDVVSGVVDQLQEFGETRRGWLGVRIQNVTPDMVGAVEGLETARGAMITDVPAGPALDAGLEAGDVILTFDGTEVADTGELVRIVAETAVDATVPVEVLRDGEMQEIAVTLGRREDAEATFPAAGGDDEAPDDTGGEMLGLSLAPLTDDLAAEYGIEPVEGLIVTQVDPSSDAASKGVMPGDVITEAGQQPVATVATLEERLEEAREAGRTSILMLVRRGGDPRFVALVIDEE